MDLHKEIEILKGQKSNLSHLLQKMSERNQRLEAERERLRKALQEIKEELEYDISNGKVALDLALAALEDK